MRLSQFLPSVIVALCASGVSAQVYSPGTLAAFWPLNETNISETNVADTSGNANTGGIKERKAVLPEVAGPAIVVGGGPTINSVTVNAVNMDGVNDAMYMADSAELDFNKQKGTISLWIRVPTLDRRAILRSGAINNDGLAIEQTGSSGGGLYRIFFHPNAAQGFFMCTSQPVVNTWEHYVFAWDYTASDSGNPANPNRVKAWRNGVAEANATGAGGSGDTAYTTVPTTTDWVWGKRYLDETNPRPFSGRMAEIAVYDYNFTTDAEAQALYTTGVNTADPGLIAYYDFSEGVGATSIDDDATLDSNNDVMKMTEPAFSYIAGGPQWVAASGTGLPPYITRSLQFDGVDDCVIIPDSASLDFDKTRGSVVLWMNTSVSGREGLIGDSSLTWTAEAHSSAALYFQPNNSATLYLGGTRTVNTWMHVAFTWDRTVTPTANPLPTRRKMYFNGTQVANTQAADSAFTTSGTTADWTIGRRGDPNDTANPRWFAGQMADVAMFNTQLSDADITYIVNNGVQAFLATSVNDWTLLDE
ncbi:hypothetical protein IT570_14095 [Candidatus Sumerlaeota bacterium]|nr:hypothetical protein [Candidatus Sumerlaeota bacterium]